MILRLQDYIREATNYLGPESESSEKQNRERILAFCEAKGLVEKFSELVASNSAWRELASSKTVKYLVDVIDRKRIDKYPSDKLNSISLSIFDVCNPVPVIKIMPTVDIL